MRKWKYTLKNSKKLRNAIKEENYNDVLQILLICYREVINYFIYKGITKSEDFEDEYNYYTENIQDMINYGCFDENDINYELNDFYDLCDNTNIWIEL
jgi:hypothetical protein